MYFGGMHPGNSSLKIDRYKKIIATVNLNKRVSLYQLEKLLAVSRITVQRDLVELEKRKLLRRFHGGAMSIEYSEDLYDHDLKKSVNVAAKKIIAAKAAQLIKEDSYIGLDSSSTVYYLSETIFAGNVLVLTCCIDSFKNLINRDDIRVVLAGGRMNKKSHTLSGPEIVDMIRKFRFDMIFISAESYIPEIGFFDPHAEEVQVKRALIESANRAVMLIDASKVDANANGIKVCDISEIDFIVTDKPEESGLKKSFNNKIL
ncbi:MAG: DeoR/GlpR transcriptional regulator [Chitinispirillaceae bacterium]|nr:DeoR/GlpR transcriptional regulator [Chitinispirillaceae bacterium]